MNLEEKKNKIIEARNRITEGIRLLREVFNNSKEDWNNKKGYFPSLAIAQGFSIDICSRLDDCILKINQQEQMKS